MNALSRFSDAGYQPQFSENDFQQYFLEKSLIGQRTNILESNNPAWAITAEAYRQIDKMIHENIHQTKSEFHIKRIALLGGIIINTDSGLDDYFIPRNFEVMAMN